MRTAPTTRSATERTWPRQSQGMGGKYRGVAPDATVVAGKVRQPDGCAESAILEGMKWAAREKKAQADKAGNKVEQTVIHAYRVKR
jgi:hypothetical protein